MGGRKSRRPRVFVWLAILILLPVIILALVGFSFLRQDRLLARRQAQQRAQEFADELLPKCLTALLATNDPARPHVLLLNPDGGLASPPPIAAATPKLLDLSQLNSEQLSWWQQMQGLDTAQSGLDKQLEAARTMVASNIPDSFLAIVLFWLGSLEQKLGNTPEALRQFERLVRQFPEATGETGLPLAPLARLRTIEIMTSSTNQIPSAGLMAAADLCSNVVSRPSQISEPILEAVAQIAATSSEKGAIEDCRTQWQVDQAKRQLYAVMHASLLRTNFTAPFWFHMDEPLPTAANSAGDWLAFCPEFATARSGGARNFSSEANVLTPLASGAEPEILETSRALNAKLETGGIAGSAQSRTNILLFAYTRPELLFRQMDPVAAGTLPVYLGVAVEVAGKNITPPSFASGLHVWREVGYIGRKGGGVKKEVLPEVASEVLGSAAQTWAGRDFLRVNVYLTSPSDLFKRQHTRTFWLGSVIGTSFLAALAGLLATWRSFSRQEQLAEMKTNFVSSVSHELRAPIASVRLLAESLERGSVSTADKQHQYYHFIGQECRRLSSLIENVLDFSRIEQGRKQYEFEPTDIAALVRQTVTLMDPYAAEREVSLAFDNSGAGSGLDQMGVMVDGQAIQQALINLIDNAMKHSAKGQAVKVGLAVESRDAETNGEERSAVRIYVEDHGPGIPEAEHEKIFERFYRLGSELRRETQGIGIGLSIVKHIMEAHGGKVIVRSSPGAGSRFTLELPMVQPKAT